MDQSANLTLSQQVRECLEAGMRADEGHQYVGIYVTGYNLIANLLVICQMHTDPQVRFKAKNYLDEFDQHGGIGTSYKAAYRFSIVNRIKNRLTPRKKADRGMRRLRGSEAARIEELVLRTDLNDDEQSEVKRIHASVVDGRIASVDYAKLRRIILSHTGNSHANRSVKGKNGWRHIDEKTWNDIQSFLDRPDISDVNKNQMFKFLDNMEDRKMLAINYIDAMKLVADNRASKEERAKRIKASDTFENAISMACQACDNLDDMKMQVLSKDRRISLVAKIGRAAAHLLQLQSQLIQEDEDNGDER